MMNISENLALFQELISCNHRLYLWHFSPEMVLLYTNCPENLVSGYQYFLTTQTQTLLGHARMDTIP